MSKRTGGEMSRPTDQQVEGFARLLVGVDKAARKMQALAGSGTTAACPLAGLVLTGLADFGIDAMVTVRTVEGLVKRGVWKVTGYAPWDAAAPKAGVEGLSFETALEAVREGVGEKGREAGDEPGDETPVPQGKSGSTEDDEFLQSIGIGPAMAVGREREE